MTRVGGGALVEGGLEGLVGGGVCRRLFFRCTSERGTRTEAETRTTLSQSWCVTVFTATKICNVILFIMVYLHGFFGMQ